MEIKAPNKYDPNKFSVFLAGSIEKGEAVCWRQKIVNALAQRDVQILNPRRDDWDSTWVQSIENEQFREQVEWELQAQEDADIILMYFDPKAKSSITLLEFGLFARTRKLVVYCPEGYWRKGNIDIVCRKYGVQQALSVRALSRYVLIAELSRSILRTWGDD